MLELSFAHLDLSVNFTRSRDVAGQQVVRGTLLSLAGDHATVRPLGSSTSETVPVDALKPMPDALNALAGAVRHGCSFRQLCDAVGDDPESVVLVMTSPVHRLLADGIDREWRARAERAGEWADGAPRVCRDPGRPA